MTGIGEAIERLASRQRAAALLEEGRHRAALTLSADAVRRFPDDAVLACRHADALHLTGDRDAAAAAYRRALALDDRLLDGWHGLGSCHLAAFAYGAARAALERAVALRADAARVRCSLAEALFQLGEVDAAVRHYALAADSGDADARAVALANLACIAPGAADLDNAAVLALRRAWVEGAGKDIRPLAAAPCEPGRKLRVGYVSAFFGARNWMKPVFGVINAHDRDRFEIHMLADGEGPSASAGYRDHPDDRIWLLGGLSNAELAQHIVEAGLDVLVDLNGYSAQRRLPLFLYRPARLQVGWFSPYATTGIEAFDCLVCDDAVLPPPEEQFYCEPIRRVPGSYLAFRVAYEVPEVEPPPCLGNGHVTFGCLCSAYKLTGATVAAWSAILAAAPGAKLLVKNNILHDASNRAALVARFAAHGVAEDRLLLEAGEEHFAYLAAYARIDVALDPFPYNGGTTTIEALWQGVPVLSFNGDRWASRTSRSLLLAAGLADWVAPDRDAYVAAAIDLAKDPGTPHRLGRLRAGMRARLLGGRACDSDGLCHALEALYLAEAGPARDLAARNRLPGA
jgi:protein O-GlcNAc transferase